MGERLSVLIPARNEIYLQKTIENVLENAEDDIEVIAILDGYWPSPAIKDNPKVKLIHHSVSIGQRQAINQAAKIASGKYIMKLDAHCAVDKGFDVKLKADCEYNWTVIPRMRNLDIETWTPKFLNDTETAIRKRKLHDYMYVGWNEKNELRTLYYPDKENWELHQRKELIDDTMSCMGCCFFMHKDRFWELGGCDESHGGWGSQGIEVALKSWLSGGALKVNKKTWFAHWFRASDGGFPYPISGKEVAKARDYSKTIWLNNQWEKQTRTIQWLVEKFTPPTWNGLEKKQSHEEYLYNHVFYSDKKRRYPQWKGHKVIKFPNDLILYEQIIWENKPDFIIECGTAYGGSTLFLADMLELNGRGKVISIDINPVAQPPHPRIDYIIGRTTAVDTLEKVRSLIKSGTVMAILDSDHRRVHVKRELFYYSRMITPKQYIVVEDCWYNSRKKPPAEAVDWFLKSSYSKNFKLTDIDSQFVSAISRGGWIQRQ